MAYHLEMSRQSHDPIATVLDYHERTKHHPDRYAAGPGYLDWASQPDPFRRYLAAEIRTLDLIDPDGEAAIDIPPADGRPRRLDRSAISQLFFDSLALSAWKQAGTSRWSLRVNPSSGNLHPTESYLLAGPIPGLSDKPGLFHYAPYEHALERRRELDALAWWGLTATLPQESIFVGLTSIHWRESWKYGERAFRYCQHDAGHAIAAVAISAAHLGWHTRMVTNLSDQALARLLGIDSQAGMEAEHADCLLCLFQADRPESASAPSAISVSQEQVSRLSHGPLLGTPNTLSRSHRDWPVIQLVARATETDQVIDSDSGSESEQESATGSVKRTPRVPFDVLQDARSRWPRRLIRTRRSALALDGTTSMSLYRFYRMVRSLSAAASPVPFASIPWTPAVHMLFYVHRVRDLAPGLYILVRNQDDERSLRAHMRSEFVWSRPAGSVDGFYLLAETDTREAAMIVSCRQEIASDGVFACSMLARFEPELHMRGPHFYRCLHWETGVIGQVLYLEAEAAGIRGTGIGCFFDDLIHRLIGFEQTRQADAPATCSFQSLYNFTMGGYVDDPRLRSLRPYEHLRHG